MPYCEADDVKPILQIETTDETYDTELGAEAAECLKLYLDSRRKGSPTGRKRPENINDNSPLIRDGQSNQV